LPLGVLWAAYGWAAMGETGWRAPAALFALGLVQDQLSGGPLGLFAFLYLAGFLLGRTAAAATRSPNLFTEWGGFVATMAAVTGLAAIIAPPALGGSASVGPFAIAATVTALLFPLVRPLYIVRGAG
jgi:rod shape-determining protein MreD